LLNIDNKILYPSPIWSYIDNCSCSIGSDVC